MLCQTSPETYQTQFDAKISHLSSLLGELPQFSAFPSAPQHYRARAEFFVWHEGAETDYIMFDQTTKKRVKIKRCPMVIESIGDLMPKLMTEIVAEPVLRERLYEVDFLATLSGEMLVSLIYKKSIKNDQAWLKLAQTLKSKLPITHLIGRARKEKVCLACDYVLERLEVDGKTFLYQQVENSFTQPNPKVAQNMLSWARKVSADATGDLIELYCGNGHFSIALAEFYDQVLATEISKTSVNSAKFNIKANGVENVTVVKLAAAEVVQALRGERVFNRLAGVDLNRYQFQTILVDPPRSGLDDVTRKMVAEYERIIYISCNPETLAYDLESLKLTHHIIETALFDQFPYTQHIESGVYLQRKT